MAQTANAFTAAGGAIEYATDGGTTYTDMAGVTTRIVASGGERATGLRYTLDGETAIVTLGKLAPYSLAITLLDENATTGTYADFLAAYANGTAIRVRWSPAGGTTGDLENTSSADSYVTVFPYGSADSEEAAAHAIEMTMLVGSIGQAAAA